MNIPGKYLKISLLLSFIISLVIHFSLITSIFIDTEMAHRHHEIQIPPGFILTQFWATFLFGIFIFLANHRFYKPLNPKYKLNYKTVVHSLIITLVIAFVAGLLLGWINKLFITGFRPHRQNIEAITSNLFCSAIVLLSINVIRFINLKQTIELEVEKLKTESLNSQFESLKNQMSPHFLFNSLTALNNLVEEDPITANTYINRLSQVLRYSLQSNKKQTVTVDEELDFLKSYLFLLKIRYGENLSVKININKDYFSYKIPPLTLQILIENAVKHNEISKSHPLLIKVLSIDNRMIQVVNKIQEKLSPEEGNGIGLHNLSKLFSLLGKEISILNERNEFRVEIPLIKPNDYEGTDH